MGEKPSDADNDLLQRLNALKPSSVQLESRNWMQHDLSDDEYEREETQRYIDGVKSLSPLRYRQPLEPPSYSAQGYVEDEEDIEELLADLRTRDTWKFEHELETENEINNLVDEAKKFLLRAGDEAISARLETPNRSPEHIPEDKEAEDYVRKVLDELQTPSALVDTNSQKEDHSSTAHKQDGKQNLENSLELPSVPTSVPERSPESSRKQKNIFTDPDDLIPTWCSICSDDADVRCLNCPDIPLYCRRCCEEVHIHEFCGDERRHSVIEFRRTKGLNP